MAQTTLHLASVNTNGMSLGQALRMETYSTIYTLTREQGYFQLVISPRNKRLKGVTVVGQLMNPVLTHGQGFSFVPDAARDALPSGLIEDMRWV